MGGKRVLVGMSGGIDSSVAAYILRQQGYDVSGITMRIRKPDSKHSGNSEKNSCFSASSELNIEKAVQICSALGIPHRIVDVSDLFERTVLENFKSEYLNGRTPNPCVMCNQMIKFGAMVDLARKTGLEFDYFATGHYARIERKNGRFALLKGKDEIKDQSYFLYRLSQKQLSQTLFPLGEFTKEEIRKTDAELGLHPSEQKESQDFYGGHYTELLDVQPQEGEIVDTDGRVLGHHNGMWNYTVGQRKGLGISAPYPLYVIDLDPVLNRVVVGYEEKTENPFVTADNINIVSLDPDSIENGRKMEASAKIRSASKPVQCVFRIEEGRLFAEFAHPVKAATCGQSIVIYDNDTVLCGGIICREKR